MITHTTFARFSDYLHKFGEPSHIFLKTRFWQMCRFWQVTETVILDHLPQISTLKMLKITFKNWQKSFCQFSKTVRLRQSFSVLLLLTILAKYLPNLQNDVRLILVNASLEGIQKMLSKYFKSGKSQKIQKGLFGKLRILSKWKNFSEYSLLLHSSANGHYLLLNYSNSTQFTIAIMLENNDFSIQIFSKL